MYTTFFVNNSKSRKNVSYGKLSVYLSVITGSYVVTYLGRDDLNLKIPLIMQLTLGSWSKVFPPILGNMANNEDLATAIAPYF